MSAASRADRLRDSDGAAAVDLKVDGEWTPVAGQMHADEFEAGVRPVNGTPTIAIHGYVEIKKLNTGGGPPGVDGGWMSRVSGHGSRPGRAPEIGRHCQARRVVPTKQRMRGRPPHDVRGRSARDEGGARVVAAAVMVFVGGCMITSNPDFDEPSTAGSATSAAATTALVPDTGETTAATTQGGSTTGATTTLEPSTTAGESTAPPLPGYVDVPAATAACVFLPTMAAPFAGPAFCEQNAVVENGTGQAGVLILDQKFMNQGGDDRPALVYLRFEVPEWLAARTMTNVVVHVTFADGQTAGSPWSGDLHAVEPFTADNLESGAPMYLDLLVPDPGPSNPGQTITWGLSPTAVVPGQPAHFGLRAIDDDGVLVLGEHAVTNAPMLRIDYE